MAVFSAFEAGKTAQLETCTATRLRPRATDHIRRRGKVRRPETEPTASVTCQSVRIESPSWEATSWPKACMMVTSRRRDFWALAPTTARQRRSERGDRHE